MRFLFLTTRRSKPSYRFRVEKLRPFFQERGHECETALLPNSFFDRIGLFKTAAQYDAVVLQKRLLNRLELGVLFGFAQRLVYDFDDAVMLDSTGQANPRCQRRFRNIVRAADMVIAGNRYLADEANRFSPRVTVLPTPVDTTVESRTATAATNGRLCRIGWTGSRSTNKYLNDLFPVLGKLKGRIEVRVVSDSRDDFDFQRLQGVPVSYAAWSPENEVSEPAKFDIGVMPLPDNAWTRGKCGFKALQYMALGVPAVCSPVGVNREIITHGQTGLLPDSPDEWLMWLTELLDNPQMRQAIGTAGRRRAEETYSLEKLGPLFVDAVESAVHIDRRAAAA